MERCAGIQLPTNMVSMHAPLAWFDVCSACTNIVLHTDGLVVALAILNCAAIWNLNFAFPRSAFCIRLRTTLTLVGCLRLGRWIRLKSLIVGCTGTLAGRKGQHVKLNVRMV